MQLQDEMRRKRRRKMPNRVEEPVDRSVRNVHRLQPILRIVLRTPQNGRVGQEEAPQRDAKDTKTQRKALHILALCMLALVVPLDAVAQEDDQPNAREQRAKDQHVATIEPNPKSND